MALVVSDCARGAQEGSLLDSSSVAVDREVCWTYGCVVGLACGETQEEHVWSLNPEEERCR